MLRGQGMRRHLVCAALALCCWCGPAQAAEGAGQLPAVTREEQRLLKKWGLACCLSTYAHAGRLSPLAAEAAERLYGRNAVLFDAQAASLRAFLAARVRDRMPCKDGENCSLIGCLNAVEHLDMTSLADEREKPAAFRETVRPAEGASGKGGVCPRGTNASPARHAARAQLKKFALAACLRRHAASGKADAARTATERARAAFRGDLGLHAADEPYRLVEETISKLRCEGRNAVLCCLDALETETFDALIRAQDSYAPEPSAATLEELLRNGHL